MAYLILLVLANERKECMKKCEYKQGPCLWCGIEGMCCSQNKSLNGANNGCDATFGGETRHECALNPGILTGAQSILHQLIILIKLLSRAILFL